MKENIKTVLGIVGITMLVVLALSLPTMWLWNYVMPVVFSLPEISLVQTIALLVLSELFLRIPKDDRNERNKGCHRSTYGKYAREG